MKKDNNKQRRPFSFWISCVLVILCCFSCREPEDGCLDIEATNYDVSADNPCPDCCIYPKLKLEISYRFDSLSLVYGNPYTLPNDSVIKITKSKFYISDIRLTKGTKVFEVRNRINLDLTSVAGPVNFKDDFTLISRDFPSFNYNIGEIRGTGTFDTLRFFVGLDETANLVNPDLAPEDHELAIQADSMWSFDDAYFFNKLNVVPDTSMMDMTRMFNIFGPDHLVEIVLPFEQRVDLGLDVVISIKIDYKKWLEGINFAADSEDSIINNIVNNTTKAFSIIE